MATAHKYVNNSGVTQITKNYLDTLNTAVNIIDEAKADKEIMSGATAAAAGSSGLVPAPEINDNEKFLRGDGTWAIPTQNAASTNLGLVKSGGDVTISSGVITINDDSHNHTIANIDELQNTLNGKAPTSHVHDKEDIISVEASAIQGTINIDNLPVGALERCIIVEDDNERFNLTILQVQKGDTVKVNSTGKMYFIIDDTKLTTEAGYTPYTAGSATSVPWSGVSDKPSVTTTLTGDVTGTATTTLGSAVSIQTTLPNSGVTAGTYKSVTVDAKGRITAGTNPTTVDEYGITDAIKEGSAFAAGQVLVAVEDGTAKTTGYTVEKSVPADAKFTDTTYNIATQSIAGLMSATDKSQLDNIASTYLAKTTYEFNKELAFGSTGKLLIGKFPCYDTNITVEINATTSITYHGILIIATQNINTTGGGTINATVYGDATNTIAPNIYIEYGSGSNILSVYFSPAAWSKNLIHIQAVNLQGAATDVVTSVNEIPSTAKLQPANGLINKFSYSDMIGATSETAGTHGLVPAPAAGMNDRYLRSDGVWANLPLYNGETESIYVYQGETEDVV